MTISGRTKLIAHLGYPTESFKAPMIYNPYFERYDIDAVVVPMGCKAEDYSAFLKLVFNLSNIHGALVTMPHKVTTVPLLDEVSTTAKVAGACNAIRLGPGGKLVGDMFDGEGFVRGVLRKGRALTGARVLVVGSGGVGSAIVASMAKAGVAELALFDAHVPISECLGGALAYQLSRAEDRGRLQGSRRVRCRRQRNPPRHEGRRSAADGRRSNCALDLRG